MGTYVKWWKDKLLILIFVLGFLAVGLSALFAILFPNYIGLCIVIVICAACGIPMRLLINKKIEEMVNR
jgi:hypothetical protein